MIVPMKKVAMIVQSKDASAAINTLGSLGVLHVEHQKLPQGKDVDMLRGEIALIDRVVNILSSAAYQTESAGKDKKELSDWKFTARHIIDSHARLDRLEEYGRALRKEISEWEAWGDFDPEAIGGLIGKNIFLRLYRLPVKEMRRFPAGVMVRKISAAGGVANCVAVSREKINIPFKELALPKAGISRMRARFSENWEIIESIRHDTERHVCYRELFVSIKKSLEKELEFQEALEGMGEAGEIMYLTGYIPHDTVAHLLKTAKSEKWGITIKDPSEKDVVPTLIRNPRWVSIINPVFKLLDIIPGYRELDISLWFLLFFSVFFGMLIGDAAYGAIFFVLTLFFHKKFGKKVGNKSIFALFYILSSCAVIWGLLTGTFFGQAWLPQSIKPLIPALRDSKNIQTLCFFLGALQLSVAHLWRSIVRLPSLRALADIGWTIVLWGVFFLARALILGDTFPVFGKWFFITGVFLVVFFTNPRKNIIKGIGSGLGNLLMNIVNSFTDVVSYIRLFAVGLATVAIADAFNGMAMDVGYGSVLAGALTAVILLLGHALNIILGPLAILVHGVRLNVLEFCSHLDITWSGVSYKPLKK